MKADLGFRNVLRIKKNEMIAMMKFGRSASHGMAVLSVQLQM
jgi:hypothetical protein